MKLTSVLALVVALSTSSVTFAQTANMNGMKMDGMNKMDMKKCMDMKGVKGMDMKGMDMKGMDMGHMDAQKCNDMMKNTEKKTSGDTKETTHKTNGVVKALDADNGKVTLAHGAVKSLGWPAMTMTFSVKDKALLDKLGKGKNVHVEFQKEGSDYVIKSVK